MHALSRGALGTLMLSLGLPLLAAAPARAQVEFSVEGPISAIDPAARTLTVAGVVVAVPPGTPIRTATNPVPPALPTLTLADMATGKLPGRSEAGFIGATAIVEGTTTGGVATAADVFMEPSENVLLGEATDPALDPQAPNRLHINGVKLLEIDDPRLPTVPARNALGFRIVPTTIPVGTLTSAEGYYSKSREAFFYHTLESDGGTLRTPNKAEVSATRAQCRDKGAGARDELEVRGGIHTPATGRIRVQVGSAGSFTNAGTVAAVASALPGFGEYRFKASNLSFNGCPPQVRVQLLSATNAVLASEVVALEAE